MAASAGRKRKGAGVSEVVVNRDPRVLRCRKLRREDLDRLYLCRCPDLEGDFFIYAWAEGIVPCFVGRAIKDFDGRWAFGHDRRIRGSTPEVVARKAWSRWVADDPHEEFTTRFPEGWVLSPPRSQE